MSKIPIQRLSYKIIYLLGKLAIKCVEFIISLNVREDIYLKCDEFLWVKDVESYYPKIKAEYDSFISSQTKMIDICKITEEQYKVVKENEWSFIPLIFYGTEIKEFKRHFPVTTEALAKIPNVTTVFFSVLNPGTNIGIHRGAFKGYLRYQLGIKIPKPEEQCGLKFNNMIYHWSEGKSVIFDDTYLHSAWNHSTETRTVLYVDFIRPMNHSLVLLSKFITLLINKSPYVQNAIYNLHTELNNTK